MTEQIQKLLDLKTSPVAMSFCDEPPEQMPHVEKAEASGCSYWRRAAEVPGVVAGLGQRQMWKRTLSITRWR